MVCANFELKKLKIAEFYVAIFLWPQITKVTQIFKVRSAPYTIHHSVFSLSKSNP